MRTMTVKKLMKELSKHDQNALVVTRAFDHSYNPAYICAEEAVLTDTHIAEYYDSEEPVGKIVNVVVFE